MKEKEERRKKHRDHYFCTPLSVFDNRYFLCYLFGYRTYGGFWIQMSIILSKTVTADFLF
uniref:Candidate secreted effector n=1 Tax=Meloidogyne incognita TaxID=6306 RepID=A0A914LZT4_MELIC